MDLTEYRDHLVAHTAWESLEELVTSPDGFGLDTATPVQRAWCWVLQNNTVPDHLWAVAEVQETFGGVRPMERGDFVSREILLLAGVRGAKTLICGAACVWFAIKCDLSQGPGRYLKRGERPRVSLVSARMSNAQEAFNYVRGALTEQPRLMPLLHGEPKKDSLTVRHPTGRLIDIKVVAMSARQGVNLVSRWCAGVLFDEAPRMVADDSDGKVNLDGMVRGVRARMLAGAPIMYIGSPVGAVGYVYNLFIQNFGKTHNRVTVGRAKGSWLNPVHWTPERIEALKSNPQTYDDYLTDELAQFRDVESQMFTHAGVAQCMREGPMTIAPVPGKKYTAVIDPATRGNAWTLIIANSEDNVKFQVNLAMEWIGSKMAPLSSRIVFQRIKEVIKPYGIEVVGTDQWAIDPLRDIAREEGLDLAPAPFSKVNKTKRYLAVKFRVDAGLLDLPPVENMREDLLFVKQLIKGNGDIDVKLPESADGRHCDFAAGLALLCGGYIEESDVEAYQREQGELPTEDDEQFESDDSFAARAAREWNGDDERDEAGHSW